MTAPGAVWGATDDKQAVSDAVEAAFRWGLFHPDAEDESLEALTHMAVLELLGRLRDARASARPSPRDGGAAGEVGLSRQDLLDALASAHEQQVAAESRAETAERRLGEAVGVLRRVEWIGRGGETCLCPICGALEPDEHAPNCALAAQLGAPAQEGGASVNALGPPVNASGPSLNALGSAIDPGTTPSTEDGHGRG